MKILTTTISIIFYFSITAFSQTLDSFYLDIEEVIVSENRIHIPFSDVSRNITIVDKYQIEQLKAQSINEVLQTVAGLDIRQRGVHGVQADLSIRGGTFEQALILINGIKMIDVQTGHHMMNLPITLEDIERIEILKGPGARVYGQNAFSGAINIITKTSDEIGGVVGLDIGSYGLLNARVSLDLPLEGIRQKVSGSYNHSDGYRDNTDYHISNLYYQADTYLAQTPIQILAGHTARNFGANSFYGNETFTEQYEETRTTFLSASSEIIEGSWRIQPKASWRRNKDNWQFRRSNPEFFQNFHTSDLITGEVHGSYSHSAGILGIGVEYNDVRIASNNLGDRTRSQLGVHLEHRFILADDKIDITPGIYVLDLSDFGTEVFPGLDIGYNLGKKWKLYTNIGRTSRVPSYTDLFYQDAGNIGNPDLVSESALSYELGGKYNTSRTTLQMSYFRRDATDLIDWFKLDPDDRWMPDNFGAATFNGVDLAWTQRINKSGDFISISYLYLDASFEENDFAFSRNALENLRHQLNVQSSIHLLPQLSWGLSARYNDRVSLDNYLVMDSQVSYDLDKWTLYLKASNLFDISYRETNLVEMPGRWIVSGMRYRFR